MTQVFPGKGRNVFKDFDYYGTKNIPVPPKITLNKVQIYIIPEARLWLKVMVEDQRGQITPHIKDGILHFSSPGKITLTVSNFKKKTEQEIVVRYTRKGEMQHSEIFPSPEKSTEKEKQILTSTIVIPKDVIETINMSIETPKEIIRAANKLSKRNNDKVEKRKPKTKTFRQPKSPRDNKLNFQGMSVKEFTDNVPAAI